MGNSQIIKQRPYCDSRKNICFGGDLEVRMIQEFNQFDIVWYSLKNQKSLKIGGLLQMLI